LPQKVFVAMSGGVDSSVAALILKAQGYDVTGITMQIWPLENAQNKTCCGLDAIGDAQRVAWELDIPHYVMNFRDDFTSRVVDYFCKEYIKGRTPNPCIACNRYIKFHSLLGKARAMGADYIATGHYARIVFNEDSQKYELLRAVDRKKDQSYALYSMTQEQLQHTLFPLGGLNKEEVRNIARQAGLPVAEKAESQEICFIEKGHYADFVGEFLGFSPPAGDFIDKDGCILGRHRGIHYYTIGQRKGLGLALGRPLFVNRLDPENNTVRVGELPDLMKKRLLADNVNYISGDAPDGEIQTTVKVRYSALDKPAVLMPQGPERVAIHFKTLQKAITPGQAVVFYQAERILGGGTIHSVLE